MLAGGFNPLPAFLPGDTIPGPHPHGYRLVSIHSRHFCREIHSALLAECRAKIVSIHSRHFCREIPPVAHHGRPHRRGFNPLPAFLPGDTLDPRSSRTSNGMFQSTPGISAGRYPEATRLARGCRCFNPLPAFLPGDTGIHHTTLPREPRFQSTPGISAGRYLRPVRASRVLTAFQSTPGISAGRYSESRKADIDATLVSIHSRHFCREIRKQPDSATKASRFQSTPGISAGRYAPSTRCLMRALEFQFTPGISAGRYVMAASVAAG